MSHCMLKAHRIFSDTADMMRNKLMTTRARQAQKTADLHPARQCCLPQACEQAVLSDALPALALQHVSSGDGCSRIVQLVVPQQG